MTYETSLRVQCLHFKIFIRMKKNNELPGKEPENDFLQEPSMTYGVPKETTDILYDIPVEYLLEQVAKAEKDIEEGRLTSHEEMKKRFQQ